MKSILNHYTYKRVIGRCVYTPYTKLATGHNVLHIACKVIISTSCHQKMLKLSNRAREGLAELRKMLHACGEDVNAQNSNGRTPLHIVVMRYAFRDGPCSTDYLDFPEAVRSLMLAGANPDLRDQSQATSLHTALIGYANVFRSKLDLKELNSVVELLLKSGAKPQAKDSQGFSPLHALMKAVFMNSTGYPPLLLQLMTGDHFAFNRQTFHKVVRTIRSYGGCAHATTNDGRSVFDMCKDDELLEKIRQDIPVTSVHLKLSRLAAAAIRKHQLHYRDKLPTRLIQIIERWD